MSLTHNLRKCGAVLGVVLASFCAAGLPQASANGAGSDFIVFFSSQGGVIETSTPRLDSEQTADLDVSGTVMKGGDVLDSLDSLDTRSAQSLFADAVLAVHLMSRDGSVNEVMALSGCQQLDIGHRDQFDPNAAARLPEAADAPGQLDFSRQMARCDGADFSVDLSQNALSVTRDGTVLATLDLPPGDYRVNGSRLIVK